MSNNIGVIFHDNWEEFSPLLYCHNGAVGIPLFVQDYLKNYDIEHKRNRNGGHLYNPEHMIIGFVQSLNKDIHMRVQNLTEEQIDILKEHHECQNYFDGGCWIIDVSVYNYGNTECGGIYYLDNDNIVNDELKSDYD